MQLKPSKTTFKVPICKNQEWMLLLYLAKQSRSCYVLPPRIASCKRCSAEAGLDSQLFPLLPPPCLFFSLFTHVVLRDERCFSFFGTFWPSRWVCGFLRNGVSEQLLAADPGSQHMSLKSLSITPTAFPPEAGQLSVSWNDTFLQRCQALNIK